MYAVCAAAITFFLSASLAFGYTSPGSPSGHVNDFANVISQQDKTALEERLTAFAASSSNEVAIVTVKSIGEDYIENYAVKLFDEWRIGTQANNNGVLLLVAVDDRQLRIEVGYGLEGALPDSVVDRIIQNEMMPFLREGNYSGAIRSGTEAIIAATQGEYAATGSTQSFNIDNFAPFLVFGLVIIQWLFAILARTRSWWLGGIVGLAAGGIMSSVFGLWLSLGLVITLILSLVGLLFDFVISRAYQNSVRSGSSPPWWSGGTGGSGGFGGRGGGGFGGFGGGRSGGGGASGRW